LAIFHVTKPGTDCLIAVKSLNGPGARILMLSKDKATKAWKTSYDGKQYLLESENRLVPDELGITLLSDQPDSIGLWSFPQVPIRRTKGIGSITFQRGTELGPEPLVFQPPEDYPTPKTVTVDVKQLKPPGHARDVRFGVHNKPLPPDDADFDATAGVWQITVPPTALDGVNEVYLKIDYAGDAARAYIGDKLIDDDFYYGKPWEIGLKRFAPDVLTKGITLKIVPLRTDNPIYIQPEFRPKPGADGQAVELRGVSAEIQYAARMQVDN
jgi:hypothetical protein